MLAQNYDGIMTEFSVFERKIHFFNIRLFRVEQFD
jgi:hypothetical protein